MGYPIDPRMHRLLPKAGTPEEFRVRREADAKARGMTLAEYDAWLDKEGSRLAAEAAADPSTDDI